MVKQWDVAWTSYDITSCTWHKSHDFLGTFQWTWVYKGRFSQSSSVRLSISANELLRLFKPLWFCIRSKTKLCLAAMLKLERCGCECCWRFWCRTAAVLSFRLKTKSLRSSCFQSNTGGMSGIVLVTLNNKLALSEWSSDTQNDKFGLFEWIPVTTKWHCKNNKT